MPDHKVYEEWDCRLIPAPAHGPNVHYRVFVGTVQWDGNPDSIHRAFVVFMQYGNEKDWKEACRQRQIAFDKPPHLTNIEEVIAISDAIDELDKSRKAGT